MSERGTPAPPAQEDERREVDRFLAARDESSFRAIYRRHTPALLLLARRLLGPGPRSLGEGGAAASDAEDAVQETWVRAVRRLSEFRWESRLRTWLASITVNCCRELARRRAARPEAELLEPDEIPTWPATAGDPESREFLESLVRALPEGYRQILVLHDLEGYTHEEIGELLGIHAGTSKSQLSRARKTLRSWLTPASRRTV